ncbi:polysaccharide deacetylase family protein [Paenibacillus sp. MBLB4367]|uniref:polysaccharide deacetylase family protein n=1 Tax=Paenibacillus sp. MBLB4367 TaxID=3384767 RepID=UPI00390840EB
MQIRFDRFPGGRFKTLTLSFDDGRVHDRRLVQAFNKYGLKGTFHLNSGTLGREGFITAEETASLFEGHEVSAHTVNHPFLEQTPSERIITELAEDRSMLEQLVGYPVKGMSYPFGTYNERVVSMLPALGIEYARTVNSTGTFDMPSRFLTWNPTCHHKQMLEYGEKFISHKPKYPKMSMLYVWGHSYEFENDGNWDIVDQFGQLAGNRDDIWYATNAEIAAYMQAVERLRFSARCTIVHNPSAIPVWIGVNDESLKIDPGAVVRL